MFSIIWISLAVLAPAILNLLTLPCFSPKGLSPYADWNPDWEYGTGLKKRKVLVTVETQKTLIVQSANFDNFLILFILICCIVRRIQQFNILLDELFFRSIKSF